jgi:CxxC motif-containing protein
MNEKEITCIVCPIGCKILLETDGKHLRIIDGDKCKRGVDYARAEALDPRRILTSSILVKSGEWPLVSVKTTEPIPKNKLFLVLNEIKHTTVNAPIKLGDIILKNVCDTGINVIATKTVHKIR